MGGVKTDVRESEKNKEREREVGARSERKEGKKRN
jgi:hypothetical protein